jgi:hypothetical protein
LLGPGFRGFKCKVVKFEKEIGHDKKYDRYTVLVLEFPNGQRFWCDIVNAYSSNEIVLNEPENKKEEVTKAEDNSKPEITKKKPTNSKKSSKTTPVSVF